MHVFVKDEQILQQTKNEMILDSFHIFVEYTSLANVFIVFVCLSVCLSACHMLFSYSKLVRLLFNWEDTRGMTEKDVK